MDRQIALIALAEHVVPDMEAVVAAIRSRHPDVHVEIPTALAVGGSGSPLIQCAGEAMVVMSMAAPMPPDAWELPSRRATAMWPEAGPTFARHRAHVIVSTVAASSDRLRSARSITAVVQAIIATMPGALAVVWDSLVAHPAARFLEMAACAFLPFPEFPYLLWVSLHPFQDGDIVGVITFGLSSFVGRELELECRGIDAAEALDIAAGLVATVLQGSVPGDGENFEPGNNKRLLIHHGISRRVPRLPVLLARSTTQ
jgi:hypothetical protein